MCERDFTWPWHIATTHQGHAGRRLVRRAIGAPLPVLDLEMTAQGVHGGRFECLFIAHRRQNAGKTAGQHGLAGARRSDHQEIMPARGCHFQCAPRLLLALYIGEVGIGKGAGRQGRPVALQGCLAVAGGKVGAYFEQRMRGIDAGVADQCRFVGIGMGQDEGARHAGFVALHRKRHGQRTPDRAQLA